MTYYIAAGLALVVMTFFGVQFKLNERRRLYPRRLTLIFKGSATFTAALLAVYAAAIGGGKFAILIAVALFIGGIADIVLELNFIGGMIIFAVGHFFYYAAFIGAVGFHVWSLWIWLAMIVVILVICLYGHFKTGQPIWHYLVYGTVLVGTLAFAAPYGASAIIAAALFVISDAFILFMQLGIKETWIDLTVIITYYIAQYLFALTALIHAARALV